MTRRPIEGEVSKRCSQFFQDRLNLPGAISVYLTVCWMFL
jgi:hypothetical protein